MSGSKYETGDLFFAHPGDILGDGKYKIVRKIGVGGFSIVWLAEQLEVLLSRRT